jgi:hypothetical protein
VSRSSLSHDCPPGYEPCPGCCASLPTSTGPVHPYIGASPACWALFSDLFNGGHPPVAPTPANALLGDAYAAQHPGTPSAQAIQSVAVHLLTLHGALVRGVAPTNALWIRRRALRERGSAKPARFRWLQPPVFAGALTIADIVAGSDPTARANLAQQYVDTVWSLWSGIHGPTIACWYDSYVVPD